MNFQNLTPESQQAARETLSEILKLERDRCYELATGQSKEIATFVKEAFIELEMGTAEQCGQTPPKIECVLSASTANGLGIQLGKALP